jgi:predicted nucleic acid-binding protein
MVSSGELALILDARILIEYEEVLARPKFKLAKDKVADLLDYIEVSGLKVASSPLAGSLPDADDEPFLEAAISGRAACLVTGNKGHFPPGLRWGIVVLSPREFLAFYKKHRKTVR